jgi:hypothetical protein
MSAVLTREELIEIAERQAQEKRLARWSNGNHPSTWRPFERTLSPQERAIARKLATDPGAMHSAWDMPEIPPEDQ